MRQPGLYNIACQYVVDPYLGVWGDILPTGMPQLFLPVKKYRQSLAYLIFTYWLCGRMFGKLLQPEAIFWTENA